MPSYSPCRLLCPECVLLCRRNGAGIECKNKERQCEPIQSHCLSSRKLFFSWRILGKYLIMYLHIEWQRALNGSAFFALALILLAGLISAFSLYSINWYPNFNYPTNYLQVFVQYLSFRRQTNGMNHVILRIPKGVNITSIIPSCWSDAVWRTLCSNPHSQTPKNPETAFHKRQFRDFHNLDQLLANRSKMTLSIWIFSGTITLYSQNILSNSLYQQQ